MKTGGFELPRPSCGAAPLWPAAALGACLAAAGIGCGDDGGGPAAPPETVEDSLAAFGVDLAPEPRVDDDQDPLPDDYSPFGSMAAIAPLDEIALIGVPLAPATGFDGLVHLIEQTPGADNTFETSVLGSLPAEDAGWADGAGEAPARVRSAAALDLDGDGLEEVAVVSAVPGVGPVELRVIEDAEAGFAAGQPTTVADAAPLDVAVAAGDFDGDGRGDLLLALVFEDGVELRTLENDGAGGFGPGMGAVTVPRVSPDGVLDVALAAGNLDYDNPWELAVVVNERFDRMGRETGSSRVVVFDDGVRGYAELARDLPIRADGDGASRTAITGSVAMGDLDGDGVDELVLGGLSSFPETGCTYEYVLLALDDAKRDLAELGDAVVERTPFGRCDGGVLRTLQVGAFDLDGDGAREVHANGVVFDDFRAAAPFTEVVTLPFEAVFAGSPEEGFSGRVTRDDTVFATGDVTSDERQDLIVLSQSTGDLRVWGLDMIDGWTEIVRTPLGDTSPATPRRPILLTPNADADSLALDYSEGEYQLVFTEPVLIAVLSAPPCAAGLGQNLDACRTSFGTAESDTVETEDTWTITAGVSVGFSTSFSAFGVEVSAFEAVASVKGAYAKTTSEAYTLTKRVEYTTGPNEDGVIFTTIPYDQYTYTILSHPEPALVGEQIVVSLPREPVEILVDRDFYNANVVEGGVRVDDAVLGSRPGDLDSYPTVADKNGLVERFDGLETRQVDVGQGGGSVGVGINVFEETGTTTAYGVEFELEVRATIGAVVAGFSVGGGLENSLRISHGVESDYAGTVSNMSAGAFATEAYAFGLFTYVYEDPATAQQFEVISYWVD